MTAGPGRQPLSQHQRSRPPCPQRHRPAVAGRRETRLEILALAGPVPRRAAGQEAVVLRDRARPGRPTRVRGRVSLASRTSRARHQPVTAEATTWARHCLVTSRALP